MFRVRGCDSQSFTFLFRETFIFYYERQAAQIEDRGGAKCWVRLPATISLHFSRRELVTMLTKQEVERIVLKTGSYLRKNSPTVLTCLGAAGVVATAVVTAKTTPKALKLLEQAEEEKGDELTKVEKVKTAAPAYIPAMVIGGVTIGCIFGADILGKRKYAALMSAYNLLDGTFKDYTDKVIETYGEEAHRDIVKAITVENAEDRYIHTSYLGTGCDLAVEEHSSEPKLFYDVYSNRYFRATIEQVITAEYHLNRNYILRGSAILNELYDFLGLKPTAYGDVVGWAPLDDGMYWIDFNHHKAVTDDGVEYYVLEMPFAPTANYDDY